MYLRLLRWYTSFIFEDILTLACHVTCFQKLTVSINTWTRLKGGVMKPILTVIEQGSKKVNIR